MRSRSLATASAVALTAGTKSAITASTRGSASKNGSTSSYEASDAEPSMSTGLARLASLGSSGAIARTVASVNCGSSSPAASSIRTQDSEATGVGQDGHPPSSRHRLRGEQRRHVDELLQRARADDARLMKECIDCRLGAGKRRGVRTRCSGAGTCGSALHREDGLRSRDTAGERPESSRIAEGLEVEQHHLRCGVVLPPLEQVVRGDVSLVPDRDERGQAEAA